MDLLDKTILRYIPYNPKCRPEEKKNEFMRAKEKREFLGDNPLSVSVQVKWEEVQPDMSVCRACKEVIYGAGYQLTVYVNSEAVEQARPVKLCQPCYEKSK